MKTVIVGGVAGGASAAARLRRLDEKAEIIIFEKDGYVSFANCGLPYYIGGEIKNKSALTLQTPESFRARFNIDVRINSEVTAINESAKTVTVKADGKTFEESYDNLILSPGASPIIPKGLNTDSSRMFTLRNIPDAYAIREYIENNKPQSALIVGGGYIGVEMAENLKSEGLDVTIVELADHLIAPLDYDMSADVAAYVKQKGIKLILNKSVRSLADNGNGVDVCIDDGMLKADFVILSVGVRPETHIVKGTHIAVNDRGSIIVNSRMETSVQHIYAVGDAVEVTDFVTKSRTFIPLAGPANRQGRTAADNISGLEHEYKGTQGSSVLKIFNMTVATTGITEKQAKASCIDYDKTYIYSASHAGYYPNGTNMSVKALWEKESLRLIGAQIVGFDGVDKRMDVLATAIRFGAKVTDLADLELCYAPPFGSAKDPVNMLGFVAQNITEGKLRQFFWDDVAGLPRDGSVTLLDVRTKTEVARGHIDGFMNIPLDSLREHLSEIEKGKPVYVHCHSGLRSYIACRILSGYGYECYNLAGGWRLYECVTNERKVPEYVCTECK